MTQSEVLKALLKVESQIDVRNIRYGQHAVWPILRYHLSQSLLQRKDGKTESDISVGSKKETGGSNSAAQKLVKLLSLAIAYYHGLRKVRATRRRLEKNVFLALTSEPYPDRFEGRKYSRYIDPYFEEVSGREKAVKIQMTDASVNGEYYVPTLRLDEVSFLAGYQIIEFLNRRSRKAKRNKFLDVVGKLNSDLIGTISYQFPQWIVYELEEINRYDRLFTELLTNTGVKRVFFENYYTPGLFGLISACKKLKIKTVDVQHGVVDINYLGWRNTSGELAHYLPDFYWVWSKADVEVVSESNHNTIIPVPGGNRWLAKWRSQANVSVPPKIHDKLRAFRKCVLVSLQPGMMLIEYTSRIVRELVNNSTPEYLWLIRFHPQNSQAERQVFRRGFETEPRVEMEWASSALLYEVFNVADSHLVGSSAVALEGLQFDLPTIIFHPLGKDLFHKLIEGGNMRYASTPEEIFEALRDFAPEPLGEDHRIRTSQQDLLEGLKMLSDTKACVE